MDTKNNTTIIPVPNDIKFVKIPVKYALTTDKILFEDNTIGGIWEKKEDSLVVEHPDRYYEEDVVIKNKTKEVSLTNKDITVIRYHKLPTENLSKTKNKALEAYIEGYALGFPDAESLTDVEVWKNISSEFEEWWNRR